MGDPTIDETLPDLIDEIWENHLKAGLEESNIDNARILRLERMYYEVADSFTTVIERIQENIK